jgi:hypothetical protein
MGYQFHSLKVSSALVALVLLAPATSGATAAVTIDEPVVASPAVSGATTTEAAAVNLAVSVDIASPRPFWIFPEVDPGLPFLIDVAAFNVGELAAENVTVVVDSGSLEILAMPEYCDAIDGRVQCHLDEVVRGSALTWRIEAVAPPDADGSSFPITVSITSLQGDADASNNLVTRHVPTFRTWYVSNRMDGGIGSLRWAIEQTRSCDGAPCKIAFRIEPESGNPWHTIELATPLPELTAPNVWVDGMTQTLFFGDTNPAGPEIELKGRFVSSGSGLVVTAPCRSRISDLAINEFPANGVLLLSSASCTSRFYQAREVINNYIGTSADGTSAAGNLRGVFVDTARPPEDQARLSDLSLFVGGNLISGNSLTGIYLHSGSGQIVRNVIGLNRDLTVGLGNGASGIYFGGDSTLSTVVGNYIGFNHHFGIGIRSTDQRIGILANSIQANRQTGIDYELDGLPTPSALEPPVIQSVIEDTAAGVTTIRGTIAYPGGTTSSPSYRYRVYLYANDMPDPSGRGEGQYFLAEVESTDGTFAYSHHGELPGRWVTSTLVETTLICVFADECEFARSSEFGRVVPASE